MATLLNTPLFSMTRRWQGFMLALITCVTLSGCGFQLKKASYLPDDLRVLHLSGTDSKSALFMSLRQELKRAQVRLLPSPKLGNGKDAVELHLYRDSLERQTLSLFKNGQVAQYELAYSVRYRLTRPGFEPVEQEFELYRNYQDDPDNALGKSQEREIILSELRQLASRRIIRELSQL
ncbi:LPS assembly lipoprotein LptE [Pseudoalteromonas sp. OOF1S-7]|uniref:LPS-assembly lipoprotein LptE n=1 Tax=Pseudoalteromonas sp. OOF1S-7 TaxID=2917757 RepID=UPI001EF5DFC5|nr:LPS assembly lipoprotein LptE [Pseudoalteromonas sp. OOF1S-7]MCG7533895.1 LPS assembly lipoprotein LptE [Pseudoalteromonas sp. OOF1S-7]